MIQVCGTFLLPWNNVPSGILVQMAYYYKIYKDFLKLFTFLYLHDKIRAY